MYSNSINQYTYSPWAQDTLRELADKQAAQARKAAGDTESTAKNSGETTPQTKYDAMKAEYEATRKKLFDDMEAHGEEQGWTVTDKMLINKNGYGFLRVANGGPDQQAIEDWINSDSTMKARITDLIESQESMERTGKALDQYNAKARLKGYPQPGTDSYSTFLRFGGGLLNYMGGGSLI